MTDDTMIRVRETAAAHADAVRQTQRYLDGVADADDPSVVVEYADHLRREQAARSDRRDALTGAGVDVASIDGTDD